MKWINANIRWDFGVKCYVSNYGRNWDYSRKKGGKFDVLRQISHNRAIDLDLKSKSLFYYREGYLILLAFEIYNYYTFF